jgi:hypothetical protein
MSEAAASLGRGDADRWLAEKVIDVVHGQERDDGQERDKGGENAAAHHAD